MGLVRRGGGRLMPSCYHAGSAKGILLPICATEPRHPEPRSRPGTGDHKERELRHAVLCIVEQSRRGRERVQEYSAGDG